MAEKKGIKESQELIEVVIGVLGPLFIKRFKDGFQVDDLSAIFAEIALNPEVKKGFEGLSEIPAEFADLDSGEIVQLVLAVVKQAPKLINSFK